LEKKSELSWLLKIALQKVFYDAIQERLCWTIGLEIWPLYHRVKLYHFEVNRAPNHPSMRSFPPFGRSSGFFRRRKKLVGMRMPGAVSSWAPQT
jgi:hypothetical protein